MNTYFLVAGGYTLLLTLAHIIGGGRQIAAPLLASSELEDHVKYLHYYCWHIVSFCLALMGLSLLWSGFILSSWEPAVLATILAILLFGWGIILVIWKNQNFKKIPQGFYFVPIIILSGLGFLW